MPRPASAHSLPPLVSDLVAPLPRRPIEVLLSEMVRRLTTRRPDLLRRLGSVANVPIAVSPDDLPHAFLITLGPERPSVRICDKDRISSAEAVVRAPLLDLLGVLDGTYDGDALFFSRDLRIEGKTEFVLALRNTLEEADLTPGEFIGLSGSHARWVNDVGARMLGTARQVIARSNGASTLSGGGH
ncbi:ubiquinone anaerobic biosynthesis accessory factor UbiT [Roseibium sp. Sym1]|uniref:ubiquinone anaerobic biosynthesis accessory factor UbiT n=1 Tax=Roseibium sp. Sym1 TaxID=3016006 RepID=UPI0022B3D0F8|nr:SCP2 sterol-binding domain-containing protein [Roseibium sp. Sym1]